MKKSNLLFAVFLLTACVFTPQATVTPDATVTLPPIPTPTLHPQMSALQEKITASGDRFTLDAANGLIYDGETLIPGLTVAPDGAMSLTVNGESVTLDPADVDFDDENGITIDGYEWDPDANDGAGAWVEATETVTANFDLGVILAPGEANEDGSRNIETFAPPEEFADNEGAVAKWLNYFDAERLGFDPGATQWILTEDGRAVLVDSADHSKIIAEWKDIPWIGKAAIVWNAENMVEADGEHPLLDVCENWELKWKGGLPLDREGSLDFIQSLRKEAVMAVGGSDMLYGEGEKLHAGSVNGAIFSSDGKSAVIYLQIKSPMTQGEGFIATRDLDGNAIILFVENMEWEGY
ncbi:MAG: hypothetical protein DYG86_09595 [Chloroflexi bacterium CFX2]|nr:hypothetical protein [Chloroflexi bacterium CFX2]